MNVTEKSRTARREFLKGGIRSATIGAVSIGLNLREALSQSKHEDKTLLTERTLNRLIPKEAGAFRELAIEAKRDLKGFITKHFFLTPPQTQQLNALSQEELSLITEGIDMALEKGKRIKVQFVRPAPRAGLEFTLVQKPNLPKWSKNVYIDGTIEPFSVVIGVKGTC